MRQRILVLGYDDRSGLAVVRSLGRAGYQVHLAWPAGRTIAASSRHVTRRHDLPRPGTAGWQAALIALVAAERIDLVLPCDDRSMVALHRHRAELAPQARIYTLNETAFADCFDKRRTSALARRLGVKVAEERQLDSAADLAALRLDWPPPIVVKPVASVDLLAPGERRSVVKVADLAALPALLQAMLAEGPVLLQANFPGCGAGVEVLARQGRILAAFQHLRVHEPAEGGGSSYRTSVPLQPELLAAATAMAAAMQLTGVAMFEFRLGATPGSYILIEVNGRFWGSLPLAVAAGMDFPRYLVEMLLEDREKFPAAYRVGLFLRNLSWDLPWFLRNLHNLRANQHDPALLVVPLGQVAREAGNLLRGAERIDTLAADDPWPFAHEVASLAFRGARHALRRIHRPLARAGRAVNPARLLGRRRRAAQALAMFAAARQVVFVCKGNICRSPFAERLAWQLFPGGVASASAGFYPRAGRPSPAEAMAAAAALGVDLVPHRSRVLDAAMVAGADVLVVFDEDNHRAMRATFPAAMPKVVRIADLLPGWAAEVPDPWGQDRTRFDACYRAIATALARIAGACRAGTAPPAPASAAPPLSTIAAAPLGVTAPAPLGAVAAPLPDVMAVAPLEADVPTPAQAATVAPGERGTVPPPGPGAALPAEAGAGPCMACAAREGGGRTAAC